MKHNKEDTFLITCDYYLISMLIISFRKWTKKSRDKAVRVEKEIVMLRQLLDEGLPKEAVSYLTLVSDCLKQIEKVSSQSYFFLIL